jgi:integrase
MKLAIEYLSSQTNESFARRCNSKRMFRLAFESGRLRFVPHVPMLEENNARQGFVDHAQLREHLPNYLEDRTAFLYLSGWRLGEMKELEWRDVDLAGRVVRLRSEISTNNDDRVLLLSGELLEIVERAKSYCRLDCPYLFQILRFQLPYKPDDFSLQGFSRFSRTYLRRPRAESDCATGCNTRQLIHSRAARGTRAISACRVQYSSTGELRLCQRFHLQRRVVVLVAQVPHHGEEFRPRGFDSSGDSVWGPLRTVTTAFIRRWVTSRLVIVIQT